MWQRGKEKTEHSDGTKRRLSAVAKISYTYSL